MKNLTLIIAAIMMSIAVNGQKYFTKSGTVTFESDAALERIEAVNSTASSVMDAESGNIQWAVLIKAFKFEKALMEEHFNENYMESSEFPKAVFKGKITDISKIDFSTDGEYVVDITGAMNIHGVSKEMETKATFIIQGGVVTATSSFELNLADFNIEIPSVVAEKIAKTVTVKVETDYELLKK